MSVVLTYVITKKTYFLLSYCKAAEEKSSIRIRILTKTSQIRNTHQYLNKQGNFLFVLHVLVPYLIKLCFVSAAPSDSQCQRMLGSNPWLLGLWHWQSDALTTRLYLIHNRLDLIHNRLDLIHNRLDLIHSRLDLIHNRLDLIHNRLDLIHNRLEIIHNRLDLIHSRLALIHNRLDLIHNRLALIHNRLALIYNRLDLIHSRLDLIHNRLALIHMNIFRTSTSTVRARWLARGRRAESPSAAASPRTMRSSRTSSADTMSGNRTM